MEPSHDPKCTAAKLGGGECGAPAARVAVEEEWERPLCEEHLELVRALFTAGKIPVRAG